MKRQGSACWLSAAAKLQAWGQSYQPYRARTLDSKEGWGSRSIAQQCNCSWWLVGIFWRRGMFESTSRAFNTLMRLRTDGDIFGVLARVLVESH